MHVVYGTGFDIVSNIVERLSGMVVLLSVIFTIQGGYCMFPVFILVVFLMYKVYIPDAYNNT